MAPVPKDPFYFPENFSDYINSIRDKYTLNVSALNFRNEALNCCFGLPFKLTFSESFEVVSPAEYAIYSGHGLPRPGYRKFSGPAIDLVPWVGRNCGG